MCFSVESPGHDGSIVRVHIQSLSLLEDSEICSSEDILNLLLGSDSLPLVWERILFQVGDIIEYDNEGLRLPFSEVKLVVAS